MSPASASAHGTHQIGPARAGIAVAAATVVRNVKRQTARPVPGSVDGPAANEVIGCPADTAGKPPSAAEGQLPQVGQYEYVPAVEVVGTVVHARIVGVVVAVVVESLGPGVMRQELISVREALLELGLQRMVIVRGIVEVAAQVL